MQLTSSQLNELFSVSEPLQEPANNAQRIWDEMHAEALRGETEVVTLSDSSEDDAAPLIEWESEGVKDARRLNGTVAEPSVKPKLLDTNLQGCWSSDNWQETPKSESEHSLIYPFGHIERPEYVPFTNEIYDRPRQQLVYGAAGMQHQPQQPQPQPAIQAVPQNYVQINVNVPPTATFGLHLQPRQPQPQQQNQPMTEASEGDPSLDVDDLFICGLWD